MFLQLPILKTNFLTFVLYNIIKCVVFACNPLNLLLCFYVLSYNLYGLFYTLYITQILKIKKLINSNIVYYRVKGSRRLIG